MSEIKSFHSFYCCVQQIVEIFSVNTTFKSQCEAKSSKHPLEPLLLIWFNFDPACISNSTNYKVRDETAYPYPNVNGATDEVNLCQ